MVQYRTHSKLSWLSCGCWARAVVRQFQDISHYAQLQGDWAVHHWLLHWAMFHHPWSWWQVLPLTQTLDPSHSHYSASPTGGALLNCFTGTQTWKTQGQCFCIINAWMQSKSCSWLKSVSSPLAPPTHYSLPGILTNVWGASPLYQGYRVSNYQRA